MKINEIIISPSALAMGIVGENFTLQCTVYLLQPTSSSKNVTSHLKFKWLQSPSSTFPAYKTVVQVFNPTAGDTEYYTQLQSIVQFSPLQASDAGTVSCELGDNEILAVNINIAANGMEFVMHTSDIVIKVIFSVPNITVEVTTNKTPVLGQDGYSLTCEVTGAENLNPSITYQWTKIEDTDHEIQFDIGNNSNILFFDSLSYLDAGVYICQVDVNSDFLNENISFNSSLSISIYPGKE